LIATLRGRYPQPTISAGGPPAAPVKGRRHENETARNPRPSRASPVRNSERGPGAAGSHVRLRFTSEAEGSWRRVRQRAFPRRACRDPLAGWAGIHSALEYRYVKRAEIPARPATWVRTRSGLSRAAGACANLLADRARGTCGKRAGLERSDRGRGNLEAAATVCVCREGGQKAQIVMVAADVVPHVDSGGPSARVAGR